MEAIKAIIHSDIDNERKSRLLVTVVKERTDTLTETIVLLTSLLHDKLLQLFLANYDDLSIHKRERITANSASDWTSEELAYFMIEFNDTDSSAELCEHFDLTQKAKRSANSGLTCKSVASGFTHESATEANTEFKRDALFVVNMPSNESSVDDMVKTLLSSILSDRFLVKTRYDMQLRVSSAKRKATADLIVMLFPQLYVGIVIVEDKSHDTSKNDNQWDNAEAQTIAEGIAVMQQKNWPIGLPVFALRVLSTSVTIYRLCYDRSFLDNVERGIKRDTPYVVIRLIPDVLITGQRPGWDLLDPKSREIVVTAINDISIYIETEHP